jgi:hypothetical protein
MVVFNQAASQGADPFGNDPDRVCATYIYCG